MTPDKRIQVLKESFWAGEIGDAEFRRLAFEAGLDSEQIAEFMAEVREHDGIPA